MYKKLDSQERHGGMMLKRIQKLWEDVQAQNKCRKIINRQPVNPGSLKNGHRCLCIRPVASCKSAGGGGAAGFHVGGY